LLLLHGSRFKYLKSFYNQVVGETLRRYFPAMPYYERFVALQQNVLIPLMCFLCSRLGHRTGIYYFDSIALAVCHNRCIGRHKTFAGLADELLLNARIMAETIIGLSKLFPRSISSNTMLRSMRSSISWPP